MTALKKISEMSEDPKLVFQIPFGTKQIARAYLLGRAEAALHCSCNIFSWHRAQSQPLEY